MDFNDVDLDHLAALITILEDRNVEEAIVAGVHLKFRAPEPEGLDLPSTPTVTKADPKPKSPYAQVLGTTPPTWTSTQKTQG